jgi:hypothetical protein
MKPLNQSEPISAEEFYSQFCSKRSTTGAFNGRERLQVMIEFAKMHVEAALKEASATDIVSGKSYKHRTVNMIKIQS